MPLEPGSSPEAFSKNVATEMHAGKPQKQSLAIAYSEKERTSHREDDMTKTHDDAPAQPPEHRAREIPGPEPEFKAPELPEPPGMPVPTHDSLAAVNRRNRERYK
jgi:hypothetical protein